MRTVEIDIGTFFGLITCAEDYGHLHLVPDFVRMCGDVTVEEIEEHAKEMQESGYSEEDYEIIKLNLLTAFELE